MRRKGQERDFLIASDSRSCLQALESLKTDHPIIVEILTKFDLLKKDNFNIIFCWVPSHIGLTGNERADTAARDALDLEISDCQIPPSDFKPVINLYITNKWQKEWDGNKNNKLYEINPSIKRSSFYNFKSRHDQVVFTRCRLGHSRLTHGFLLIGEVPPLCLSCKVPLTIKHILLNCNFYDAARKRFYSETCLHGIFENVPPKCILDFLSYVKLKCFI